MVLSIASCVTVSPNLKQNEDIGLDEGILIVRFHAVRASGVLAIHQGAVSLPYAGFAISPNEKLKAIKIKSGNGLRISTYKVGKLIAHFDDKTLNFNIKPRTITYIGDIYVNEQPGSVGLRIVDNESETKEDIKRLYPQLFEKFSYEKFIPTTK